MPDRPALRARIMRRLSDTGISPLWDSQAVNLALLEAAATVSASHPVTSIEAVSVSPGARTITLAVDARVVTDVALPDGRLLEFSAMPPLYTTPASAPLLWRWTGVIIALSRPVLSSEAGAWSIECLINPEIPEDDVTPMPWTDPIAELLVPLAASILIRQRMADDLKRGHPTPGAWLQLVQTLDQERRDLEYRLRRRARGGMLR